MNLNINKEYTTTECIKCSVLIPMTNTFYNKLKEFHNTFYCINGHGQYFSLKSKSEELQERLNIEIVENAELRTENEKLKKPKRKKKPKNNN